MANKIYKLGEPLPLYAPSIFISEGVRYYVGPDDVYQPLEKFHHFRRCSQKALHPEMCSPSVSHPECVSSRNRELCECV